MSPAVPLNQHPQSNSPTNNDFLLLHDPTAVDSAQYSITSPTTSLSPRSPPLSAAVVPVPHALPIWECSSSPSWSRSPRRRDSYPLLQWRPQAPFVPHKRCRAELSSSSVGVFASDYSSPSPTSLSCLTSDGSSRGERKLPSWDRVMANCVNKISTMSHILGNLPGCGSQLFDNNDVLTNDQYSDQDAQLVSWGNSTSNTSSNTDGTELVHALIACAEAVACRDRAHATDLLRDLRERAIVLGTSFQRVASCFVQGLADRLTMIYPLGVGGSIAASGPPSGCVVMVPEPDRREALRMAYELLPFIKFGHFVGNAAILEAFEGESHVHVVDLGMSQGLPGGHQWRELLRSLAAKNNKYLKLVRVTGVGHDNVKAMEAIGAELVAEAEELGIPFQFTAIEGALESLTADSFDVKPGEILAVNSVLQLHRVVKESRGALNAVLQMLHELSPKVLVLVEQDSSHNGPFFLGRFMEALHYYSSVFDSLDAALPRYDTRRAKVEQFHYAEEIKNIVSCEGPARVERHEKLDQWRRRMSRASFQASPLKNPMLSKAREWLDEVKPCDGYTVTEEKGCLVLGWKTKPIIAASCWSAKLAS